MLKKLVEAVIGSRSERALKKLQPLVEQINALEEDISKLSDGALRLKTAEFKERLAKGETEEDLREPMRAVVDGKSGEAGPS